jgi:predicted nucleic acid-binding protein
MSVPRLVVHTDVILEHVCQDQSPSALRQALKKFFCYTTVFNAIELFSLARNRSETRAVEDAMAAIKVLGLNAKNARSFGNILASGRVADRWNALVGGLCVESRLPLLTDRRREFEKLPGLCLVSTRLVRELPTAGMILRAAQRA